MVNDPPLVVVVEREEDPPVDMGDFVRSGGANMRASFGEEGHGTTSRLGDKNLADERILGLVRWGQGDAMVGEFLHDTVPSGGRDGGKRGVRGGRGPPPGTLFRTYVRAHVRTYVA